MSELDNFKDIEDSGVGNSSIDLSNVYSIKLGGFEDLEKLRTYSSSVKVKDLKEDISLYETLTKDKSWPVSQIIQREVDRIRVSSISRSYVLGEGRLVKYFPPIIVALLPKAEDGKIALSLDFNVDNTPGIKELIYSRSHYNSNDAIKPYIINSENLSLVSGLFLLEVSKVFDTRLLSWDRDKFYAVVIDGQHRLEALLKSSNINEAIDEYLQDVVFIDASPLLMKESNHTPVEIVRRIFVDINTNAQRVGFVRQVLMDDKDLSSLCVQSLVDSSSKDGSSKPSDCYIRSQIVDWYGDKLKHVLPHLTGILSLYQIIDDYFIKNSLTSLNDRRSPKKVNNWITKINSLFMVDSAIENDSRFQDWNIKGLYDSLTDYNSRINESREYQDEMDDEFKESEIFQYDYRILDIARIKFEDIYLRPLVKFFNNILPHQRVIDLIESEGGFGENDVLSKALISSRKKIANSALLRDSIANLKGKIEETLFDKFFLMFTVLGQKVLFNNLFQRIHHSMNPNFSEQECYHVVDHHLDELNSLFEFVWGKTPSIFSNKENIVIDNVQEHLIDLGTISSVFWEGLIYENNNIVYNTQGVRTLSYLLGEFIRLNNCRINGEELDIDISKIPHISNRISRIIRKRFDFSDEQILDYTDDIMKQKSEFIATYFS